MRPLRNIKEKGRFEREAPATGSLAPAHWKEKYPNLVFLGFNAVFLVALFWLLPALGTDFPRPSAQAGGPARDTNAPAGRAQSDGIAHAYRTALPVQIAGVDFGKP